GAAPGEQARRGLAKPLGAAGDHGDLAGELLRCIQRLGHGILLCRALGFAREDTATAARREERSARSGGSARGSCRRAGADSVSRVEWRLAAGPDLEREKGGT